jgi:hypothetical protein
MLIAYFEIPYWPERTEVRYEEILVGSYIYGSRQARGHDKII